MSFHRLTIGNCDGLPAEEGLIVEENLYAGILEFQGVWLTAAEHTSHFIY